MSPRVQVLNGSNSPALSKFESTSVEELGRADEKIPSMFLIEYRPQHQYECTEILALVRQQDHPQLYLAPVVLIYKEEHPGKEIAKFFDSCMSIELLSSQDNPMWQEFSSLFKWLEKLPNLDKSTSDTRIPFKILRLMASRRVKLIPSLTPRSTQGFIYPLIQPFFQSSDRSLFNVLEFLEKQQLITPEFCKRAHFCPSCESAFLNFVEICPDCGSDNIGKDELLHHFKCGHVDSAANFKSNNQLVCPKCDENLRHIGVDYDKPSIMYGCRSCALSFQDPITTTQCYSCANTANVDDIVVRDISSYEISAIGLNAAVYGLDALFTSVLQTDLQLYSQFEFKNFVRVEKARITRYKRSISTIATIHFKNLDNIFSKLGKRTEQLFKEISAVFNSVFRESDVITALNESFFIVLMTETDTPSAKTALTRLEAAIAQLFEAGFPLESAVIIETDVSNLSEQLDLERLIETSLS